MLNVQEIQVLRELVSQYAEIAALPVHTEKKKLWIEHNEFRSARPMVLIDQICWWEFDSSDWFRLRVADPYWRDVELGLRQQIYCWKHLPVDKVFNPYVCLPKPIHNSGWGIEVKENVAMLDPRTGAAGHYYHHSFCDYEDIERIRMPEITLDTDAMARITADADTVFAGIIPYRMTGVTLQLGIWDTISTWIGVENCYMELVDRPEFLHAILEKLTQGLICQIHQLNQLGLYDVTSGIVHCTHTYLDNLPRPGSTPDLGQTSNGWGFGQAQLFSAVSPSVTREFEVAYMQRIHPYFGAIYYGCCERLDDRLDILAKLDKVRKISCSPWSDREHFAEALPDRRIMSVKPSPAFLAGTSFNEDAVRQDLRSTMDAACRHNRNVEFILKDISTIHRDESRLWRWAEIAMEEVQR